MPAAVTTPPAYPLELAWADLAAYRHGNTGIDYIHSFDSGVPGPHVMVNALTHGNELCGMVAVRRLLDAGMRPRAGRLTLSFANVAAYDRFGPDNLQARFIDRDFNRLWHDELLAQDHTTVEARRAHVMAPLLQSVDRLLDLHSTWHAVLPFFVLPRLPRARNWADLLALPPRQLLLPSFRHEGFHLIDYAAFAEPDADAIGLIAECGQHFAASSARTAWQVTLRFLFACGCIDDRDRHRWAPDMAAPGSPAGAQSIERYEIVQPVMATTDALRLTGSYAGFEPFRAGEIAAYDGATPVVAPFDGAIVLAPRPDPQAGQQGFAWGRRLPG